MPPEAWFRWEGGTLWLEVGVQARASRNQVLGPRRDRLKVCVTAAPVAGDANARLVKLLAREFRVPQSHVKLVRGERTREKRLAVQEPKSLPAWLPRG